MTLEEARIIAKIIENGLEFYYDIIDICDELNRANLSYKFIFDEEKRPRIVVMSNTDPLSQGLFGEKL